MLEASYTYEQWVTGSQPIRNDNKVIATGQNLAERTPLGQVTATGKLVAWDPGAADGSENAVYLTAYAVDATAADTRAGVISGGCFNPDLVAWPGGTTDVQKETAFTGTNITLLALKTSN